MAFLGIRLKEYRFTGTADLVFGVFPPGLLIACVGCRVETAATGGTIPTVNIDGGTLMAEAQILPQVAGIKRSATPGFILCTGATNTLTVDTTAITGSPVIIFYFLMAKVEPGAGEP